MDCNLVQATVMLALYDRKDVPSEAFEEYCKTMYKDEPYPLNAMEFSEIFSRTAQSDYDDAQIVNYAKKLFRMTQKPFGHTWSEEELDIIADYISARQAAFRSDDLFKRADIIDRMLRNAKKLDAYAAKEDDGMFYFCYKLNSFILRSIFNQFPKNRELAYEIVGLLNKYRERYDGIEFAGKDTQYV